jgi:hypothetical protein
MASEAFEASEASVRVGSKFDCALTWIGFLV